mgnify:CR=1 FL=1
MNQDFLASLNDERLLGWIILNVQYATAHRGRIDPNAEDILRFLMMEETIKCHILNTRQSAR